MREVHLSFQKLVLIAATRAMLGVGIGLLISGRFGRKRRVTVGATVAAIGALSTIPLALEVFGKRRLARAGRRAHRRAKARLAKARRAKG